MNEGTVSVREGTKGERRNENEKMNDLYMCHRLHCGIPLMDRDLAVKWKAVSLSGLLDSAEDSVLMLMFHWQQLFH